MTLDETMDPAVDTFTPQELDYLRTQRIGRLATVDRHGAPQNNPVGFAIDEATGQVLVGGLDLASTRKFRNVQDNPNVAFVVDDLASVDRWTPRGIEVRGTAQALVDGEPTARGLGRAMIRITPRWIATWGVEPGTSFAMAVRHPGIPRNPRGDAFR